MCCYNIHKNSWFFSLVITFYENSIADLFHVAGLFLYQKTSGSRAFKGIERDQWYEMGLQGTFALDQLFVVEIIFHVYLPSYIFKSGYW